MCHNCQFKSNEQTSKNGYNKIVKFSCSENSHICCSKLKKRKMIYINKLKR